MDFFCAGFRRTGNGRVGLLEQLLLHSHGRESLDREFSPGRSSSRAACTGAGSRGCDRRERRVSACPSESRAHPPVTRTYIPWRFLIVTRCRENLSSGEKRAERSCVSYRPLSPLLPALNVPGWADLVTPPDAVVFCKRRTGSAEAARATRAETNLERVEAGAIRVEAVRARKLLADSTWIPSREAYENIKCIVGKRCAWGC